MEPRAEILTAIKEMTPQDFVAEYIFDRTPFLFGDDRHLYIKWKGKLASLLEIDPACVTFVGSSAVGLSLNPSKGFRAFDAKSDVDVGIVSAFHFSLAWRYLRSSSHRRLGVDVKTRTAWDEHRTKYVYWGTIATDRLLGTLPFGVNWRQALNKMSDLDPTKSRDINLRIYTDHESLRSYQEHSVRQAREELLGGEKSNAEIS